MKIMVYYLALPNKTPLANANCKVAAKLAELQEKFPTFAKQIMVVPILQGDDRIEVLDMAPTGPSASYYTIPTLPPYHNPTGAASGGGAGYPQTYPGTPVYGGMTKGVGNI